MEASRRTLLNEPLFFLEEITSMTNENVIWGVYASRLFRSQDGSCHHLTFSLVERDGRQCGIEEEGVRDTHASEICSAESNAL